MPGNEKDVLKFLLENKNKINLNHFNSIKSIKIPHRNKLFELNSINFDDFFSDDARKKADVFINDKGCSIKEVASVLYNRIQRKDIDNFFGNFFTKKRVKEMKLELDKKVKKIHSQSHIQSFNFLEIMAENEFKQILYYLMFKGSPNYGETNAPAQFILEAKKILRSPNDLKVYTFEEYFKKNKNEIFLRFRNSKFGQKSETEHNRARSHLSFEENLPWCFNSIKGSPQGWRTNIDEKDRKQVYYLMIEKKPKKKNKIK